MQYLIHEDNGDEIKYSWIFSNMDTEGTDQWSDHIREVSVLEGSLWRWRQF